MNLNIKLENCKEIVGNKDLKELFIENGIILNENPESKTHYKTIDCTNCIISPGFIDPQVNGMDNCNFWETPDFSQIDELRLKLAKQGIVGFCPTVITSSKENILKSVNHINSYIKQNKNNNGALILGIHLEGIFITKYGIHDKQYAQTELTPKTIEPFIRENIVLFTLAPELDKTGEAIRLLQKNNILVSIGHSNATFREGEIAIKEHGINIVTHMFNALRGIENFSHRGDTDLNLKVLEEKLTNKTRINPAQDGIILAILKEKDVLCTLISDGQHVNKKIINYLFTLKGKSKLSLTSDFISEDIIKIGTEKKTLSGGQTQVKDCVYNLIQWNITNINDALEIASQPVLNQLKKLKIYPIGEIKPGNKAYLTIWDTAKNTIKGTIIGENLFLNY